MDIDFLKKLIQKYTIQEFIILKLKKYLLTKYNYNCASRAKDKKPETIFQNDLKEYLERGLIKIENPFTVDIKDKENTLNEHQFQYDYGIYVKGHLYCVAELKYDEVKDDGSSTNSNSEDQIKRDLYRLECWKQKHKENSCFAIFATNNKNHWEKFTAIQKGHYKIQYNNKEEEFDLSKSYVLNWHQSTKKKAYKYCIIEITYLK